MTLFYCHQIPEACNCSTAAQEEEKARSEKEATGVKMSKQERQESVWKVGSGRLIVQCPHALPDWGWSADINLSATVLPLLILSRAVLGLGGCWKNPHDPLSGT